MLWKGQLLFKQYIPLKAVEFGIETLKVCESSTGYLWLLLADKDGTTKPTDNLPKNETAAFMLNLIEPPCSYPYIVDGQLYQFS